MPCVCVLHKGSNSKCQRTQVALCLRAPQRVQENVSKYTSCSMLACSTTGPRVCFKVHKLLYACVFHNVSKRMFQSTHSCFVVCVFPATGQTVCCKVHKFLCACVFPTTGQTICSKVHIAALYPRVSCNVSNTMPQSTLVALRLLRVTYNGSNSKLQSTFPTFVIYSSSGGSRSRLCESRNA